MAQQKKTSKKRQSPDVPWKQREGWQPFTDRLSSFSPGNQGFLVGKHKVEPKRPKES